jgi:hypothetical protein
MVKGPEQLQRGIQQKIRRTRFATGLFLQHLYRDALWCQRLQRMNSFGGSALA